MKLMNITQCDGRPKCLSGHDCCYECDHNSWCADRCRDGICRLSKVKARLYGKEKAPTARQMCERHSMEETMLN